ncbi:MAG: cysteine desulfurase [Clostridiales bacterium]|jgi:cysteine desulfurase|nr:cysteine desulfurase [Clostridiales bacterium]
MMYFDNAATTPMFPELKDALFKYSFEEFYNASALYGGAKSAKDALQNARTKVASRLNAQASEIIFTSGATEANNTALLGTPKPAQARVIITAAEHASVTFCAAELKRRGFDVLTAPVDADGAVVVSALLSLCGKNTALVSVIHVSNETGAVNPINEISARVKAINPKIIFHSDGVQAFCKLPPPAKTVDLYSVSAHKINGPKGAGALKCAQGIHLNPLLFGGGQERGLRSGTENVAGIYAFGLAAELFQKAYSPDVFVGLKAALVTELGALPSVKFYLPEAGVPNIISLSIEGIYSETLLHMLEVDEIYIGLGSACAANKAGNSALSATGRTAQEIKGSLRISLGLHNSLGEIAVLSKKIIEYTAKLRSRNVAK